MTSKVGARAARDNLYVTKQRAASAKSAGQNRTFETRMLALQEKARIDRALALSAKKEAAAKAEAAKAEAAPVAAEGTKTKS